MKKILLAALLAIHLSCFAQEVPPKTNTIVVAIADTVNIHQKIAKLFADRDFKVKPNGKNPNQLITETKTVKVTRMNLLTDIIGKEVIITGYLVIPAQGNVRIEFKSTKGTPFMIAWEEMDKFAKSFKSSLKYDKR